MRLPVLIGSTEINTIILNHKDDIGILIALVLTSL